MPQRSSNSRPAYRSRARPAGGGTPAEAVEAAVRLLARRAHSRLELTFKLRRRGFGAGVVTEAMARLLELGYLDDGSFARALVRRRASQRGPLALSAELAARGIDRAQADEAIAAFDPEAQIVAATRLAERLYAKSPPLSYREFLDRIGSKLSRRGFSTTVVRAACRSVLVGASPASED